MQHGRCRRCGLCIGSATAPEKPKRRSKASRRSERVPTIASDGVEWIGRTPYRDADIRTSWDDGAVLDEIDNNMTPGTVLTHNYTEPPPRRGWISTYEGGQ